MAGDLNTTNARQLANVCRAVFALTNEPGHPFLFDHFAPRTTPTSVTSIRKCRIDFMLLQTSHFEVVDALRLPQLHTSAPIPSAQYPSDHLPIVFTVCLRPRLGVLYTYARAWALALSTSAERHVPLALEQLERAFEFFDVDGVGLVSEDDLVEGLRDLELDAAQASEASEHDRNVILTRLRRDLGAQVVTALRDELCGDAAGAWSAGSRVTLMQFREAYLARFSRAKAAYRAEMLEAFAFFDVDGSTTLTHDELHEIFSAGSHLYTPECVYYRHQHSL